MAVPVHGGRLGHSAQKPALPGLPVPARLTHRLAGPSGLHRRQHADPPHARQAILLLLDSAGGRRAGAAGRHLFHEQQWKQPHPPDVAGFPL